MVVRYDFGTMAKLLVPREQVRKMLAERIRAAEDVDAKAEIAAKNWRHGDWLDLFAKWRDDTIKELLGAYEGRAIAQEFAMVTERSEGYSAQATFETRRLATRSGIRTLEGLLEGLPLALSQVPDVTLWTACIPTFSQGVAACSMAGTTPRRSRRDSRSFETGFALWPVTKLALKLLGRGNST
jgi:hypothetical protein